MCYTNFKSAFVFSLTSYDEICVLLLYEVYYVLFLDFIFTSVPFVIQGFYNLKLRIETGLAYADLNSDHVRL